MAGTSAIAPGAVAAARRPWDGFLGDLRQSAREPVTLAAATGLGLLLAVFVLLPIGAVLIQSFQTRTGAFTLRNYADFFVHRFYYRALLNSLILATATTVVVVALGLAFTLVVTRTRSPLRHALRWVVLLPLIAPPFIFSLSLIILGGRRGLIAQALGIDFNVKGWPGVLIAQTISFLPLAYLVIENVFVSLSGTLEEAATDLGADQWTVLRTVTLPLATPGLAKAALLVFIMSLADFGNPMLIGGGRGFLATDAYLLLIGEQNAPMASVLAVFLLLPALGAFAVHHLFLRGRSFTTITGTPTVAARQELGRLLRGPLLAVCLATGVVIAATFGLIIMGAFTEVLLIRNRFTLEHFQSPIGWAAIQTSLKMSLGAATIAAPLGIVLAYLITRRRVPGRTALEFAALFGLAVPGTVMGIGYILLFNTPPLVLTGSLLILVLNTAFRELSVGMEAGISKLHQLDPSLEEASRALGAGLLATFGRVVVPLMGTAFLAGFVYTFMVGMITVSAVVFLVAPGMNLAAVYILNLAETGAIGLACALAVVLVAIVVASLGLLRVMAQRTGLVLGGV